MTYSLNTLNSPTARTATSSSSGGTGRMGQELALLLGLAALIFCVLALLCLGSIMVASASMPYADRLHENAFHYIFYRHR